MEQYKTIRDRLEKKLNRGALSANGFAFVFGGLAGGVAGFFSGIILHYEGQPVYVIEIGLGGLLAGQVLGMLAAYAARRLLLPVLTHRISENLTKHSLLVKILDDNASEQLQPPLAGCGQFKLGRANKRKRGNVVERITEFADNYAAICQRQGGIQPWPPVVALLDNISALAYLITFVPMLIVLVHNNLSNTSGIPFLIVNELVTVIIYVAWLVLFFLTIGGSLVWIALKKQAVLAALIDIIDLDISIDGD